MKDPISEALEVSSREDLYRYLVELARRVDEGEQGVENEGSTDYVRAAGYWVRGMQGFFDNQGMQVPDSPDWSTIAMIFAAAFVYE